MYIGKTPTVGNFQKCDAISTSATATFNLLVGGVAVSPETANHCIVSLNGVVQAPTNAFTISGSTIVFNSALTTADVIDFIILLGNVLDIGTPSDSTVSLAKLTATGSASSSTFLRGDNSWTAPSSKNIKYTIETNSTRSTAHGELTTGERIVVWDFTFTKHYADSKLLIATIFNYLGQGQHYPSQGMLGLRLSTTSQDNDGSDIDGKFAFVTGSGSAIATAEHGGGSFLYDTAGTNIAASGTIYVRTFCKHYGGSGTAAGMRVFNPTTSSDDSRGSDTSSSFSIIEFEV